MKGRGAFEDFFNNTIGGVVDPNKNGLANEFNNPDSLLRQAAKKTENALGSVFDPNKNGLRQSIDNAVQSLKNVTQQFPDDIKRALDPTQNGVADALNKAGADIKGAFTDLGNKILAQARADKEKLDEAFAPLVNEFSNPDSVLATFIKSQVGTEEDWRKKFEDPDTYFQIASILLTVAAAVVTAPIGGVGAPMAFAAMQTALACTKMITHAAQGKPFDPMDAIGIVLAVGGPAIGKVMGTVAGKAGVVAEKAAERLGVWNRLYGGLTPAAPAAGQWVQAGINSAKFNFGAAAALNQVAYNLRPAEAVGENFVALSTANNETSGPSPVAAPPVSDATAPVPSSTITPEAQARAETDRVMQENAQRTRDADLAAQQANLLPQYQGMQFADSSQKGSFGGFGGSKPHMLRHAEEHLRGRKAHRNIDPTYFC